MLLSILNSRHRFGDFVSLWQTTTPNETITLPTQTNYRIDWGDGTVTTNATSHEYLIANQYTIKISGNITDYSFGTITEKNKIMDVLKFGGLKLLPSQFLECNNLDVTATDTPLILGDSIKSTFRECLPLIWNNSVNLLDVSNVIDASFCFFGDPLFNQDLSGWNTSNFEDLSQMFANTTYNQSLNGWDFSSVLTCESMFFGNKAYNQTTNWNTFNCVNFNGFFNGANGLRANVTLDTSNAVTCRTMFFNNPNFNGVVTLSDTSKIEDFFRMFFVCNRFNQDIGYFDTSSAINMKDMLRECTDFNFDISSWSFVNVTDMSGFMQSKSVYDVNYMDSLYQKLDQDLVFSNMVNVNISFGSINYTSAGATARASLVSKGFIITSGNEI